MLFSPLLPKFSTIENPNINSLATVDKKLPTVFAVDKLYCEQKPSSYLPWTRHLVLHIFNTRFMVHCMYTTFKNNNEMLCVKNSTTFYLTHLENFG